MVIVVVVGRSSGRSGGSSGGGGVTYRSPCADCRTRLAVADSDPLTDDAELGVLGKDRFVGVGAIGMGEYAVTAPSCRRFRPALRRGVGADGRWYRGDASRMSRNGAVRAAA